jgi:hypothetical protein
MFFLGQRFKRSETGASMVSMSLTLPVFLLIVFGALEFTLGAFEEATLLNAVQRAGRYAALGEHLQEGDPVDAVKSKIAELSGYEIEEDNFRMCTGGDTECANNQPGAGGEWVYIRASVDRQFVFGRYFGQLEAETFIRMETDFNNS